ncbi:hypothetical protein [Secundilactobacillus muriivasis]
MPKQFKASINGNYLTLSDRPAAINLMEVASIENVPPLGTRPPVTWYSEAKMND